MFDALQRQLSLYGVVLHRLVSLGSEMVLLSFPTVPSLDRVPAHPKDIGRRGEDEQWILDQTCPPDNVLHDSFPQPYLVGFYMLDTEVYCYEHSHGPSRCSRRDVLEGEGSLNEDQGKDYIHKLASMAATR